MNAKLETKIKKEIRKAIRELKRGYPSDYIGYGHAIQIFASKDGSIESSGFLGQNEFAGCSFYPDYKVYVQGAFDSKELERDAVERLFQQTKTNPGGV